MILLDKLLTGGIRFALQRLADSVDAELNNEERLREHLLQAQMRLELEEITEEEFVELETDILRRLHEIQVQKREAAGQMNVGAAGTRVTGIEVSVDGVEE